jgi:DNA-binding response OmpR family regulator
MISADPAQAQETEILDAYLRKPCDVPELLSYVRVLNSNMNG